MIRAAFRASPLACVLALVGPVVLAGQQTTLDRDLQDRKSRYDDALQRHRAAVSEWDSVDSLWTRLEDEHPPGARDDRVLAEFQDLAGPRDRAESRLVVAARRLYVVGAELIGAIEARLDELIGRLENQDAEEREGAFLRYERMDSLLREVDGGLGEVEEQLRDRLLPALFETLHRRTPPPMPNIEIREEDTASDILDKAEELDGMADMLETMAGRLAEDVEILENRLRRERTSASVRARFERFGDNSLPVATGAGATGSAAGAGAGAGPTLEERIEQRRNTMTLFEERRDQLRERAREFREEAGRRS